MEILKTIISEYGYEIIAAIATAIAGAFGLWAKSMYEEYATTKKKKEIVATAIKAVEQIYTQIHGEEKLAKAVEGASEMLAENGITISGLELQMLIESTLAEFNGKFKNSNGAEQTVTITIEDLKKLAASQDGIIVETEELETVEEVAE